MPAQNPSMLVAAAILACTATAVGQAPLPAVPGHTVTQTPNVVDPVELAVSPSGIVFVGRDAIGSGGTSREPARVHRIAQNGTVVEFGPSISDPDAVAFDGAGRFAPAGSVLVVGCTSDGSDGCDGTGTITAIDPTGTASVVAQSAALVNPNEADLAPIGLLIIDDTADAVFLYDGASVTPLFAPAPTSIAVAPNGLIYACSSSGRIDVYDDTGALLRARFAMLPAGANLAFANGGAFGFDLVARANSSLFRIDSVGRTTTVTNNLPSGNGIAFDPSGELLLSDFLNDRVLRIRGSGCPGENPPELLGSRPPSTEEGFVLSSTPSTQACSGPRVLLVGRCQSVPIPFPPPLGCGDCGLLVSPVWGLAQDPFVVGPGVPVGLSFCIQSACLTSSCVTLSPGKHIEIQTLAAGSVIEEFDDASHLDAQRSAGEWENGFGAFLAVGGDGRHGDFDHTLGQLVDGEWVFHTDGVFPADPTSRAPTSAPDGVLHFTTFVVPDGVRVRFDGPNPLRLHVQGECRIDGELIFSGYDQPQFVDADAPGTFDRVGQAGSAGGPGGGPGGEG
ncbi:MAG: hypothetical protein KDB80_02630, partial [Planctomycetes bacterium]|nr:hypothetical protein [Planctomycetota bacterium]